MKQCPKGHDLTPENVRERWIRGRLYPVRECRTCIREKRTKRNLQYHREYMALHRAGKVVSQKPLTEEERQEAYLNWINRPKGENYQTYRKRLERYSEERFRARETELVKEIEIAKENPELAALIAEQEKDSKRFQIKFGPSFDTIDDQKFGRLVQR